MNNQHTAVKLLTKTIRLVELEKQKLGLLDKMAQTIRHRIMFGLPLDGGVAVHPIEQVYGYRKDGIVKVIADGEEVCQVPLIIFERMDRKLSKATTKEEFDEAYKDCVSEILTPIGCRSRTMADKWGRMQRGE